MIIYSILCVLILKNGVEKYFAELLLYHRQSSQPLFFPYNLQNNSNPFFQPIIIFTQSQSIVATFKGMIEFFNPVIYNYSRIVNAFSCVQASLRYNFELAFVQIRIKIRYIFSQSFFASSILRVCELTQSQYSFFSNPTLNKEPKYPPNLLLIRRIGRYAFLRAHLQ